MAATVQIDELNGSGTVTHGVSNLNAGAADLPNLVLSPSTAIAAGKNSFIKYNRLNFTSLGGATTISNVRVWMTGAFSTESVITSLGNVSPPTFTTPVATTLAGNFIATLLPGSANMTIAGSLAGTITVPGPTDIFSWQLQTTGAQQGYIAKKTWNFQWDEA